MPEGGHWVLLARCPTYAMRISGLLSVNQIFDSDLLLIFDSFDVFFHRDERFAQAVLDVLWPAYVLSGSAVRK